MRFRGCERRRRHGRERRVHRRRLVRRRLVEKRVVTRSAILLVGGKGRLQLFEAHGRRDLLDGLRRCDLGNDRHLRSAREMR